MSTLELNNPILDILHTPEEVRFRYVSEIQKEYRGGGLFGKKGPIIRIGGYKGPAEIKVFCVDESQKKKHPFKLFDKSGEIHDYYDTKVEVTEKNYEFELDGMGIVRLRKKDFIKDDLDVTKIRLGFEVKFPNGFATQTVSSVIRDSSQCFNMEIVDISDVTAPVECAGKKILLLTKKITDPSEIKVVFKMTESGEEVSIRPDMVHHQVGIAFSTPYIIGQKMAKLYLHRTSNDAKSNMIDFYFLKKENGGTKRAKESTGSSIIFKPPLKKAPIQLDHSKSSTSEKRKLFVDDFLKLGKSSSIKDLEKVLSESRKNLPSNENESDKLLKIFLNGPPDRNVDTNEIIKSQPTVLPDLASMNISDELK